ncbi:MAG: hypothetical protein OHK0022_31670 [Roseiflexaceae bacterium]
MSTPSDRLYRLLPAIYRLRDQEHGYPLRALLLVIGEQVDLIEDDIAQLYENWFIETCQDWVVPYIADLIGYRPIPEAGAAGVGTSMQDRLRNAALIPRREVANTIRFRQSKGTLALLEQLAAAVAGWPARAVEFYRLLGLSQHTNFLNAGRGRTLDLRRGDALDRLNGPFDESAHTPDVRRLASQRSVGRYNIPAIGLFVWRLAPYPITCAPAFCVDRVRNHYTFSILGNNTPLITRPVAEPLPEQIAGELNVPAFIRRRAFDERTPDYYGPDGSLHIWRDALDQPVPLAQIVPADLSDWSYRPQGDQVAVDPVLGRIAFAPRTAPRNGVWVSYHYGFSAALGGGEYRRVLRSAGQRMLYRVSSMASEAATPVAASDAPHIYPSIKAALADWQDQQPPDALIEILDSGVYVEQIAIELRAGQRLELRAAERTRPAIRLLDFYTNRPDALQINGPATLGEHDRPPQIIIDGLLITGRSVQISGRIDTVTIRHSTLVPGWALDQHCRPESEEDPSLELNDTGARVTVEHSILGTIRVNESEVATDPIRLTLTDSILDATRTDLSALESTYGLVAHAVATVLRCTVLGAFRAHAIELAENSIFDGHVHVARRQIGCMRFCYAPSGSRTPRRYNCQPDLAVAALGPNPPPASAERERTRVRPLFNSQRYGAPSYCQLAAGCAPEIKRGADDESEMGAFHDLFQPQREASLRDRLDEYMPAGSEAGIIFAT